MPLPIVMLGATGAVGSQCLNTLLAHPESPRLTLLGRREISGMPADRVSQGIIDIFAPATYASLVLGHEAAVCTLGVGEPSKMSKEDFLRIDKQAVLDFAKACKMAGVPHFSLLSSVGISSNSSSFYLRSKGELVDELKALQFERLSIFQPSMILTPSNRYGWSQGVMLKVFPLLDPLLFGTLKKYRGIKVGTLGAAMASNVFTEGEGVEFLTWEDFQVLAAR